MTAARAAVLAAALFTASCGAPLMKLPAGPGRPAPDAATLLDEATAACRRISTISAEVAVSGSVGGRRVRGRLLAGLAAPASVYIEAPAPFGAPLFIIGGTGGTATLLLPRDRRVLESGDTEAILAAITGVPLDAAELKATMTGCTTDANAATGGVAYGEDWRVLQGVESRYLRREKPSGPWRLAAIVRGGGDGWRADYRNFVNDLPTSIRLLSTEPRRFDLRLELSQVDTNVELPPATFRVAIPPGTEPISLEELRASGPLSR
jgi:hypothetical protein